jgi:heat shock protein HslJ
VKPEDLDDRAPIEPGADLLAYVHARSRSFRRHRSTQRLASVMTGLVVLALAGGIAWTRLDTTNGRGVRPAPLATSTTTLPSLTQADIMGKWRPVAIAGYDRPLTKPPLPWEPHLSFDSGDRWSGSDGCNDIGGTYRLDGNGVRFLTFGGTLVLCNGTPDFEPIEAAARSEVRGDQLTFLTADGHEIARFERAGVTARMELPSTTMTAGSSMSARVVVENNTGHPIRATKCGSFFQIGLQNTEIKWHAIWPQCAVSFTIPVGESTYPVTVIAAYATCGATPGPDFPKCATGPQPGPPPLPPGNYRATLFQSSPIVSLPLPIDVKVEASP